MTHLILAETLYDKSSGGTARKRVLINMGHVRYVYADDTGHARIMWAQTNAMPTRLNESYDHFVQRLGYNAADPYGFDDHPGEHEYPDLSMFDDKIGEEK